MILRKINGICSWFLIFVLLGHLGTMIYSMLTGWYDYNICKSLAHLTAGIIALHILIILCIVFFMNDGADFRHYKSMNTKTVMQRVSAIVIIIVLHLHVQSFVFIANGEALSYRNKAGLLITEIIFIGAVLSHLAISFTKSMMTFGMIRSDSAEKTIDRIAYIVCGLLFALTVAALFFFILNWSAAVG